MFDKKKMKCISFEKAKKERMNGTQVYLVMLDGSLTEWTEATNWKVLLFHNLKGGSFAVYRRKQKLHAGFSKEIHIGKKVFSIEHAKEGGGASWRFASYKEEE